MQITEVKVGVSVTVNLGNFNNVKIESSVTAELYENETIADIVVRLQEELSNLFERTKEAQISRHPALVEDREETISKRYPPR